MQKFIQILCVGLWVFAGHNAKAQTFDYYVLSLSWSPSWCQLTGLKRGAEQCDATRDLKWILHGLWPQYENGWPKFCKTRSLRQRRKSLKPCALSWAAKAWRCMLGASMAPARAFLRMISFWPRAPRLRQFENQTRWPCCFPSNALHRPV